VFAPYAGLRPYVNLARMEERIMSIEEVAAETPWSKTTLYRVASSDDSPFHKAGGRWVTTESDLLAWVRSAPKPKSRSIGNPMPMPGRRRRKTSDFDAKVKQLEREHGHTD
jgi:predicted DNA-binding transcriptional regulator AlpA